MRSELPLSIIALGLVSCGLEAPLVTGLTDEAHEVPPEPEPVTLGVRVIGLPGARIEALTAGLVPLGVSATAGADGSAELVFPPGTDHRYAHLVARLGARVVAAHVPRMPSAEGAGPVLLDDVSLAQALVLRAVAARIGGSLDSIEGPGIARARAIIVPGGGGDMDRLFTVLGEALAVADPAADPAAVPMVDPLTLTPTSAETRELVTRLAGQFPLQRCVVRTVSRAVFQVEMRDGMMDGNCLPMDRFLWAKDAPDSVMFITGGTHEDMEGLDPAAIDAVDKILGGWEPNIVPLRDDGTGGDAVPGDGLWTAVFDFPVPLDPEAPLWLGYKYTWGRPGQGWTDAEEWPGNRRILALADVNGDGLVVRRDRFGDETTNKDRKNLRKRTTGVVRWDTDNDGDGFADAGEGWVDLDGDCQPDGFPPVGTVGPPLADCADEPPGPSGPGGSAREGNAGLRIDRVYPGAGANGGGALVTVAGLGFDGSLTVSFGDAPPSPVFVRNDREALALTPRRAAGKVAVAVRRPPDAHATLPDAYTVMGADPEDVGECRLVSPTELPPGERGGHVRRAHSGLTSYRIAGRVASESQAQSFPMVAELGVGPHTGDPESDPEWTFGPAAYNPAGEPDPAHGFEDEYVADLVVPPPGEWGYAFRFSGDGGRSWRYCAPVGRVDVR